MPFTIQDILTLRVAKLFECGDFFVYELWTITSNAPMIR